jgi:hypothetical protein
MNFSKRIASAALAAAFLMTAQGCSMMSCDRYLTYDDQLDSWVGASLDDYERRFERRPSNVMERPQNRLEYTFETPYRQYDGSQLYCRTWLDVDRSSGEIVSWRYEGDCYMHGFCAG